MQIIEKNIFENNYINFEIFLIENLENQLIDFLEKHKEKIKFNELIFKNLSLNQFFNFKDKNNFSLLRKKYIIKTENCFITGFKLIIKKRKKDLI
jgi:hypothetical protein